MGNDSRGTLNRTGVYGVPRAIANVECRLRSSSLGRCSECVATPGRHARSGCCPRSHVPITGNAWTRHHDRRSTRAVTGHAVTCRVTGTFCSGAAMPHGDVLTQMTFLREFTMTLSPVRTIAPPPTHPRTRVRSVAAVVLASALLVVSGGVVNAATRVFTDPNDAPAIDIRKVHVTYRGLLRVRVEHDGRLAIGQLYAFWIDTRRRNAGPEYYAAFRPNSDNLSLKRVSGFGDRTKTSTTCKRIDGGANALRPHGDVTFRVAGKCLGNPNRVRTSVHFFTTNGSSADWAPAHRRLYPWVNRY